MRHAWPVRREGGDANLILNGKEGARSASFGRLLPTLVMKIGLPGFSGRRRGLLGILTGIAAGGATYWLLERWDGIKAMILRFLE